MQHWKFLFISSIKVSEHLAISNCLIRINHQYLITCKFLINRSNITTLKCVRKKERKLPKKDCRFWYIFCLLICLSFTAAIFQWEQFIENPLVSLSSESQDRIDLPGIEKTGSSARLFFRTRYCKVLMIVGKDICSIIEM